MTNLQPVDWLVCGPTQHPMEATYLSCDVCTENFVDDSMRGDKPRQMYRDVVTGEIVCEICKANEEVPEVTHG